MRARSWAAPTTPHPPITDLTPPTHTPHAQVDRFLYSTDPQVVAGALLAVGLVNCGVQDEVDPAFAILSGATRVCVCANVCAYAGGGSGGGTCTRWGWRRQGTPGARTHTHPLPRAAAEYVAREEPQIRIGAILGLVS